MGAPRGLWLWLAVACCAGVGADQLVASLAEFPPADPKQKALAARADSPSSVKGALAVAQAAVKSYQSAAADAVKLAHTPAQEEAAKKMVAEAADAAKTAQKKQYLATGGTAPKSFAQVEGEQEEQKLEGKRMAVVSQFTAKVKRDEQQSVERRHRIEREQADFRAQQEKEATQPGTSPEAKEAIGKAVMKEREKGNQALTKVKLEMKRKLAQQKANLTQAMEDAVQHADAEAQRKIAHIQAKMDFEKKQAEVQKEYDSLLAQKQKTTNALLPFVPPIATARRARRRPASIQTVYTVY